MLCCSTNTTHVCSLDCEMFEDAMLTGLVVIAIMFVVRSAVKCVRSICLKDSNLGDSEIDDPQVEPVEMNDSLEYEPPTPTKITEDGEGSPPTYTECNSDKRLNT